MAQNTWGDASTGVTGLSHQPTLFPLSARRPIDHLTISLTINPRVAVFYLDLRSYWEAIFGAFQFTGGFQLAYLLPMHTILANRIVKVIVVIKLPKKTIYKDLFLLILRLSRRVDFKPLCLNHLVDGILSLQIRAVSLNEPESNGDHQHHSKHGDRIIHIAW